MNTYDSLLIEDIMSQVGYNKAKDYNNADMVILNTCHIREKAAEKIYSELGRINIRKKELLKENKYMTIAVAGCVAQAEGDQIFKRAPICRHCSWTSIIS